MDQIPIIDISSLLKNNKSDSEYQNVVHKIDQACREVGFFYIINHGIAREKTEKIFQDAKQFFELPVDVKNEISIANSNTHKGYFGLGEEVLDENHDFTDLKEGLDFGLELPDDDEEILKGTPNYGFNQWPKGLPPSWKTEVVEYFHLLSDVGRTLLKAFAINLQVDEEYFMNAYKKSMAVLRFLKYPPNSFKQSENQLGCGEHSDYGFLTLLAQDDIGGLQVKSSKGEWINATPIKDSFVVNLGDMMASATNNVYKATPHRVISPPSDVPRISIPFFFDPNYHTVVKCFEPFRKEGQNLEPVLFGEHLLKRLNATWTYRQEQE